VAKMSQMQYEGWVLEKETSFHLYAMIYKAKREKRDKRCSLVYEHCWKQRAQKKVNSFPLISKYVELKKKLKIA